MTSSKRTLAAFLIVSVGALLSAAVAWSSRAEDERRADRLERQVEQLTKLAEAPPRVEERRTIIERTTVSEPALAAVVREEPADARHDEAAGVADTVHDEPSTEDKDAYATSVFEQEPTDVAWARTTEDQLGVALANHLGNSTTLAKLDCRSALCRVQVEHGSQEAYQSFLDQVLLHSRDVWQGPMAIYRVAIDETGRVSQNLYFARPGTDLPRLD